eukprot:4649281-Prymnesium_polylepis.1
MYLQDHTTPTRRGWPWRPARTCRPPPSEGRRRVGRRGRAESASSGSGHSSIRRRERRGCTTAPATP